MVILIVHEASTNQRLHAIEINTLHTGYWKYHLFPSTRCVISMYPTLMLYVYNYVGLRP